jgi:hypothetical protein
VLKIERAQSGDQTLLKSGVYLLSKYQPKEEVKRFVERLEINFKNHFFVLFGNTLGYLEEFLREKGVASEDIFTFDPESAGKNQGLAVLFEKKLLSHKKPYLLALESFKKNYPDSYSEFFSSFQRQYREALENLKVSAYFSKVWFYNYFRNISQSLKKCFLFIEKSPSSFDLPALVITAGPSLDFYLPEIEKKQSHFIVFCALSAARTLVKNKIIPDFIVVSDAGIANKLHAFEIPENIPILASVYANSALLSSIKNPVIFYDLKQEVETPSFQMESPSVAIDAGMLAKKLCSKEIVFCGLDLAYDIKGSHSAGNALQELREGNFSRLQPKYSYLTDFLKRRDLVAMEGGHQFTHGQFQMVARLAEKLFAGSYYLKGGLELKGLFPKESLPVFTPDRDIREEKQKILTLFPETKKISSVIENKLKSIFDKIKEHNLEIIEKLFVREILAESGMEEAWKYCVKKIRTHIGAVN